ncbi:MAG: hypothetical protein KME05_24480 [Gloeocapsa sp. UFS-A4-WI-NPMV-4B04]|nr:hypothetical protein [Gloeocapsa sp. UFS-A4-WI-NPMV-4B04]
MTWGVHLLDAGKQGLNPDYTIADAACMTQGWTSSSLAQDTLSWRCLSHPASSQRFS